MKMTSIARSALFLAFGFALCCAGAARAGETVKSPVVEKGLLEFESKGKYQMDSAPARDDKKELEFNVIYGVTEHWKTKAEITVDEDKKGDLTYRRFRFENAYQILKTKEDAFADVALYNDVTFSDRSDSSHDVTFGVLARKDVGMTTNTGNLYFRRDFGDTAQRGTNFIYRWQTKYNLSQGFQPGFEILGDTRKQDAFRDQSLGIGPALYGSFGLDQFGGPKNQKLGYELVFVFGATPATPDETLKWKLKYGVQF